MTIMLNRFNTAFPLWAILVSVTAYFTSDWLSSLQSLIVPLLAVVMFVMGLTLKIEDFRRILALPKPVAIGVSLQFLLMPLIAALLARLLQLPEQLAVGLILVGSCAGGTASNVICFLAKGDVALSITMTGVSTLAGVVATPLLCSFYLSETVAVDSVSMMLEIVQIVFLPVAAGMLANSLFPQKISAVQVFLPTISVLVILLIIAVIVALNSDRLLQVGPLTMLAVVLHNICGLASGYWGSRFLGADIQQSRTIAIEVGMQNSGLGVALTLEFFTPVAALPGALFSIWHNISGSILASYWQTSRDEITSVS